MSAKHPTEELKAYADGELSWFGTRRVRRHVQSCSSCRGTLSRLTTTSEWVRSLVDQPVPVPEGFGERIEARVMSQISNENTTPAFSARPFVQRRWLALGGLGAAAAAVVTMTVTTRPKPTFVVARKVPTPHTQLAATGKQARGKLESGDTLAVGRRADIPRITRARQPGMVEVESTKVDRSTPVRDEAVRNRFGHADSYAVRGSVHDYEDGFFKSRPHAMPHTGRPGEPGAPAAEIAKNSIVGRASDSAGGHIPSRRAAEVPDREDSLEARRISPPPVPPLLSRMKVVRTAEVTVRVKDLQDRYGQLMKMTKAYRGFIADTNITTNDEGYRAGTIVVRVPPDCFEDLVERVQQFGKVLSAKIGSEDITGEYMQLDEELPRLHAREAELAAALERLTGSRNYSARFFAQERLAEVRSRIEYESFRLRFLKDQVRLSTVTVTLTEKPEKHARALGGTGWSFAGTVNEAWAKSLVLLQFIATALVWAAVYFSVYVVLGLAVWYGVRKVRALRAAQ